ncbi:MAG: efflux transporter periplasmic adaptor subunit [Lysobacteraceae bacterium SCN 69-123]|uniref:efflux RND transporter periplasmic adaptor subunit n=1 Tax=Stenotrophomonas acidaminiphila TaxID=128780 RepID=UPI00086BDDA4|nr:efflux RND transporter periplasmic adaptor subunit [Stenotrophomonas acidaminiphila]MBN8802917.1 efflux RND transporter periplasmic adaptor subunit [Stenotrophomonas acidaminiphila]MDF9441254.1 efflux RND transporter periplasmic adaptor subunit [Stenotrophomonas acidaminiphila]ODU44143.1 MAG: efflux transporter periplasmic adaptor subunit [Xanthomonadaceae bacterium SCN 69-123]OJY77240.1 MAG: efflux transporter periplasmic adaptor subunit [Stenotrophomonas sp. 69-14]
MSRFWKIVLLVIAVLLVAGIGYRMMGGGKQAGDPAQAAGGGRGGGDRARDPVPVTVVAAERRNVPVYVTAQGTVAAYNTVTVSPQVGGELLSVDFKEGQAVKKGDLLARIDPRTFQAQYDQALASQRQNQALLATAQSNYERSNSEAYRQYVAQTDLTTLRNQVAQYQAAVAAAQATANQSRVQLGYTRIVSPIDGVAGIRAVDPGNVVSAGTAIVTLTQLQPIHVLFNLPEQQLDAVRAAQAKGPLEAATLDRAGGSVVNADGKLQVVDNQISATSGTFRLRAEFPNADQALWPGQFVNVRMKLDELPGAVVVPAEAVQRSSTGDFVYLVKPDDAVTLRDVVQGGQVDDSHVVISKGLQPGDKVVTEGQFRLKEGVKVIPLQPGQAPPEPTEAQLKAASEKRGGGGGRGGRGPR